ncbi:hypothetical protein BO71DRAFT_399419 [Aspergillus ellipticus CBS 707.79]|uniref:Uncharacterized protein n=1 Tax=Aspergillus ellipticus CBS 707.79 TaxID=1448320 RepID=A0A319D8V0_9EURO|nr:hypothetical protein BO71DRAFT_399419 [Aspergillus ellipticus CBS 707.79]
MAARPAATAGRGSAGHVRTAAEKLIRAKRTVAEGAGQKDEGRAVVSGGGGSGGSGGSGGEGRLQQD